LTDYVLLILRRVAHNRLYYLQAELVDKVNQLGAIVFFLKAAQTGNFSAAARQLRVTPQAVSSQISHLEKELGVRLFNRSTRRLSLTEEGVVLLESSRAGLESIEEGLQRVRERLDGESGTVRLAVPYGLSQALVVGLLPRFLEMYPRIGIELLVENVMIDVIAQGVDVGIVGGPVTMNSLVAKRITSFRLILCAATDYLDTYGMPKTIEELAGHRRIDLRNPRTGKIIPWTFEQGREITTLNAPASLTVNDTETHRRAVLNGAGVGQVASFFAAPYIRAGRLRPISLGFTAEPIDLHLYLPRSNPIPRKNRLLADFLVDELRLHVDFDLKAMGLNQDG
jgi:DNA-binding transcriptional LysR family regulator